MTVSSRSRPRAYSAAPIAPRLELAPLATAQHGSVEHATASRSSARRQTVHRTVGRRRRSGSTRYTRPIPKTWRKLRTSAASSARRWMPATARPRSENDPSPVKNPPRKADNPSAAGVRASPSAPPGVHRGLHNVAKHEARPQRERMRPSAVAVDPCSDSDHRSTAADQTATRGACDRAADNAATTAPARGIRACSPRRTARPPRRDGVEPTSPVTRTMSQSTSASSARWLSDIRTANCARGCSRRC